jgi:hypothetical protein
MNCDPVPWRVGSPSCGAYLTTGYCGASKQCAGQVIYAGLRLGRDPVEAWLAFTCDLHHDELIAPRELLDRDHAVLADWRDREQRALDGRGWDPPRPLAVGTAANYLVRRALRKTATWPLG